MKRTKEEKRAYVKGLRDRWQSAKKMATEDQTKEIDAIIATHGMKISPVGFMIISHQMKAQGLDGLPYLDAKTYQGWIENGFRVIKGQKSTLDGITWISCGTKVEKPKLADGDDGMYMIPKGYHLFHRSQVQAIPA